MMWSSPNGNRRGAPPVANKSFSHENLLPWASTTSLVAGSIAAAVHDGDYNNGIHLDAVEHTEGKTMDQYATRGPMHRWIQLGLLDNPLQGTSDLVKKLVSQTSALLLVPSCRVLEILRGSGRTRTGKLIGACEYPPARLPTVAQDFGPPRMHPGVGQALGAARRSAQARPGRHLL